MLDRVKRFFSRPAMEDFLKRGHHIETSYAEAKQFDPANARRVKLYRIFAKTYYDNWHFVWLRRRFSRPSAIRWFGRFEKLIRAPFSFLLFNEDKLSFYRDDFLVKREAIDLDAVKGLSSFLHSQEFYYDIYQGPYQQKGMDVEGAPATLYLKTIDYVNSPDFWKIITATGLYETCINVLGRRGKIVWSWLWYSDPQESAYQNQNWHRDTGEPFNFIRVFVPLTDVKDEDDGPTVVVKGSSGKEVLYERRRFSPEEVDEAVGLEKATPALADKGDVYFANTFCLHRGLPPKRPREMLSLLVSYQSSYRSKGLPLVPLSKLEPDVRRFVNDRKHFYSEICNFDA